MENESILLDHYNSKYEKQDWRTVKKIKNTSRPSTRFEAVIQHVGRGTKYLEIAPGSGNVMFTVADDFSELCGIELSTARAEDLLQFFKENKNIKIIAGNVEDKNLPYGDNYFDVIVMSALIEHLIDPISTLQYLYTLLAPGGKIIIDTPNIAKWTRRIKLLFGYFPSTASIREGLMNYDGTSQTDLYDEGHFHYFTYNSLEIILKERVGVKKIRRGYYGKPFILVSMFPKLFSEVFIIAEKELNGK
jgi:ubiquinone/menaquinone biosynthesis C-methylase UbiE